MTWLVLALTFYSFQTTTNFGKSWQAVGPTNSTSASAMFYRAAISNATGVQYCDMNGFTLPTNAATVGMSGTNLTVKASVDSASYSNVLRAATSRVAMILTAMFYAVSSPAQTSTLWGTIQVMQQGGGGGTLNTNGAIFVDYSQPNDSGNGTTNNPYKYIPGDPRSANSLTVTSVYFRGTYVLTNSGSLEQTLPNSGITVKSGVTYDGVTWGGSKTVITDNGANGGSNSLAAFYCNGTVTNVTIRGFQIGPLGGGALDVTTIHDPGPPGLPPCYAWGFWTASSLSNVTIDSDTFTNIGWWQNTYPIGQASFDGNPVSGKGINFVGASPSTIQYGVTVTNCEFNGVHSGLDLSTANLLNTRIVNNSFHDYLVWACLLSPASAVFSNVTWAGNTVHDIGWAYYYTYGAYYNVTNSPPHQDGLTVFVASVCTFTNFNIYGNTFYDTHTPGSSTMSGMIFFDGGVGANIYSNLFNNQCSLAPCITLNEESNGGSPPNSNTPLVVDIENNTFAVQTNNDAILLGSSYTAGGTNNWWPTKHIVIAKSNISYSFDRNAGDNGNSQMLNFGIVGNPSVFSLWTVDYNNWYSPVMTEWFSMNTGTVQRGTLALMQSLGWETHGTTNNPQFISLAGGAFQTSYQNNYSLSNSSPCLTAAQGGGFQGAYPKGN